MIKYLSIFLFLPFFVLGQNKNQEDNSFINAFKNISDTPSEITVSNNLEINNNGGHLQGIQLSTFKNNTYAIATGSSDSYSYFIVIKLGAENKVIFVNKLMNKPFKHAGGFQIFDNYLAVGIEDNSAKNKSKVCIYSISNPELPSTNPVSIIERKGEPMRSTAGCVGITKFGDKYVLAVGDWDTKHIDFYVCENERIKGDSFKKIYSLNTDAMTKNEWIDEIWLSYQNINLFVSNNTMYLVGLGQNQAGKNIADLFLVNWNPPDLIELTKVASKNLLTSNDVSFKAAAGINANDNGLEIISCGYNIEKKGILNYFYAGSYAK